ncbi:hypothetical protein GCM10027614_35250 [Micromonospora vulcania]
MLADDLTGDEVARLDELVRRRVAREPLQHLTGRAGFRHLDLAVGPGVFVPRPETELLAGWGVEQGRGRPEPVVVDLCSGSGAIALAVAQELPGARVVAVERSPAALGWLRRNAAERARRGIARSRSSRRTSPRRTCWPSWSAGWMCCSATRRTCRWTWRSRRRWPGTTRPRRSSAGPTAWR